MTRSRPPLGVVRHTDCVPRDGEVQPLAIARPDLEESTC